MVPMSGESGWVPGVAGGGSGTLLAKRPVLGRPRTMQRHDTTHTSAKPANDLPLPFGDLLRRHRMDAGLTQEALIERAGVSVRALQDLERGVTRPQRFTLQRLVVALELDGQARLE